MPTDWMTKVDSRLKKLEQDVGTLKQDVGMLKGKVWKLTTAPKRQISSACFLCKGKSASEYVNDKLNEAIAKGVVTPQEAEFAMAADLLWMGNVRQGKFEGKTIVFIGEASWTIERDDVDRAEEKAQISRKAGV